MPLLVCFCVWVRQSCALVHQCGASQRCVFVSDSGLNLSSCYEFIRRCRVALVVVGWNHRSSFPKKKNFGFLVHVRIRTILTLVLEDYPIANTTFNQENGVQLIQCGVPGNKVS
jgi:hypothetical protein